MPRIKKAMNSTGDPLSNAPLSELRGIDWLRYLAAVGLVVLIYDCLLTLDDEVRLTFSYLHYSAHLTSCSQVRLVWPGPFSISKALYYINRYLSIVTMIYSNYRQ